MSKPTAVRQALLLVLDAAAANWFSSYVREILDVEGYVARDELDLNRTPLTAELLADRDVVVLANVPLKPDAATLLSDFVAAGGNLIALRPPREIGALFGLKVSTEEAVPGAEYVITRYRQANCNLRTLLQRIIRKAGLSPWPRLFHNLRATRQSEVTERFPAHVVATWIGNTEQVAQNHYLQVTDAHFAQATAEVSEQLPSIATQKAAQYPAVTRVLNRKSRRERAKMPRSTGAY